MGENAEKVKIPTWQKIIGMGLEKLLGFWKDGEPKSKDYRLIVVLFSFLKGLYSESAKQTRFLQEIRDGQKFKRLSTRKPLDEIDLEEQEK